MPIFLRTLKNTVNRKFVFAEIILFIKKGFVMRFLLCLSQQSATEADP
jgi:hypothetical protein